MWRCPDADGAELDLWEERRAGLTFHGGVVAGAAALLALAGRQPVVRNAEESALWMSDSGRR